MSFRTLDDVNVAGQRVLVRADLNVPFENGKVTDATRITRFAPTALELAKKGAKVVILSHFGRPKQAEPEFSLRQLQPALEAALGQKVIFAPDVLTANTAALANGQIMLCENVRFHAGEEKNDPAFTAALAKLSDIYVNDAFSAAHRAHASTAGLAAHLPAVAGRLMAAELKALNNALTTPTRPVMAIVGGAKVSTKLAVLENLVKRVDMLAIGGAMANTFLLAKGLELGKSLVEPDLVPTALKVLAAATAANCEILLPEDVVVAPELVAGAATNNVKVTAITPTMRALDIGPATVATLGYRLESCRTVVWNGPMGAFEVPPFDTGTRAVAEVIARRTAQHQLLSVAGGGDTVAALEAANVADKLSYVSSAGGAFLEWLEGRELPGVAALQVP